MVVLPYNIRSALLLNYQSIQRIYSAPCSIVSLGGEAASPLLPSSDLFLNSTCHVSLRMKGEFVLCFGSCWLFHSILSGICKGPSLWSECSRLTDAVFGLQYTMHRLILVHHLQGQHHQTRRRIGDIKDSLHWVLMTRAPSVVLWWMAHIHSRLFCSPLFYTKGHAQQIQVIVQPLCE